MAEPFTSVVSTCDVPRYQCRTGFPSRLPYAVCALLLCLLMSSSRLSAAPTSRTSTDQAMVNQATNQGAEQVAQTAPPPPPASVPPNLSHVVATVRSVTVWPPGTLHSIGPPLPPERSLVSLKLEIHTSTLDRPTLDNLAVPGSTLEVFSTEALAADLVGKQIKATVQLFGDTRGVRWWIAHMHVLP